jgi:RNA polymerase sigma-70 factor, ECF subfamily
VTNQEFEKIVSTTKPAVLAAIQKYIHNTFLDSIDDVAQETYIKIYRYILKNGLESLDYSKIGNWSYTIAKNETIRFNGKHLREYDKESKVIEFGNIKEVVSFEESLLDKIEYEEVIQKIPQHFREVLTLLEEGKTNADISKILFIQPGTVKSRISRARRYINERFKTKPSNNE